MTASGKVLKPGDTIGILGGGQLGRMLAMAAARLGLRCQVFSPDPDSPAFDVVQHATCAEYADVEALELFANDVDVITYEFENVPAATAMVLAARRPVVPAQKILETTQDRLIEKDFVKKLGIDTADYADVFSAESLRAAIARMCCSNCEIEAPSSVQWPELCTRGAISLTSTRAPSLPGTTNISTASTPT